MDKKPVDRDNRIRCVKCSIGTFSDGSRIGGLLAAISPTKAQCCNCGKVYTVKARVERPYNPDQYISQAVDDEVPF
jgi:hypothetical protein